MNLRLFRIDCVMIFLLSLLLVTQVINCQDDDDDEDTDEDHNHNLEEDATNNYISNFDETPFGSESSEHVDELSGGMFGEDGESDPIDWMDSRRRQSFVRRNFPFFFRRGKDDDDTIVQSNPGSYVKQDDQEHFNNGAGNIQHMGDDIHSHSSQGSGGCSGGCDNDDHDHHHHDHHHDHHQDHHDHHSHGRHSDEGHFDHHDHSINDFHGHDRLYRRKGNNPHTRHHSSGQFDERNDKRAINNYLGPHRNKNSPVSDRMQRSTGVTGNQVSPIVDAYDPEKRNRYSGYDSKDKFQGGFTPMVHKSSRDHSPLPQMHSQLNHPFSSALSPDPHNVFPRGSFFGLDGFYSDSKLMRDKLLSPYTLRATSRKMPSDSECDDEKKKKK